VKARLLSVCEVPLSSVGGAQTLEGRQAVPLARRCEYRHGRGTGRAKLCRELWGEELRRLRTGERGKP